MRHKCLLVRQDNLSSKLAAWYQEAGADIRFEAYERALHGFTNPDADENGKKYGLPLAYSAETDRRSWQAMQDFFKEIFA